MIGFKRFVCTAVIAVICSGATGSEHAQAGHPSGWGWAKPLNKRMGAFYTSNRNANFSKNKTTSRRRVHFDRHRRYRRGHHPVAGKRYQPAVVVPAPVVRAPRSTPRSRTPAIRYVPRGWWAR